MIIRIDHTHYKQLLSRGMPPDLARYKPYNIESYTSSFVSEVDGLKPKRILKATMVNSFASVMESPFVSPYIYIISSSPNDVKAKYAAASIMAAATKQHLGGNAHKHTRGKQAPLWHVVNGAFPDRLRDFSTEDPSMLILSNITIDSTNVKIEKVRDLLEKFPSIPRILVVTGADPVTFANTRLRVPINKALYIMTAKKQIL